MEKLGRFIERLSYGVGYLAGWVLMGIIGLTMIEVVSRYVLKAPLILSDELGGYALVAITFLGLACCGLEQGHIRITFIVERLKPRTAGWIRVITLVLGLSFIAVAAWVSWQFLIDSFTRNMRANSWLMTPLRWPQMALPIGFTLFALLLLARLVKTVQDLKAGRAVEQFGGEEF